jgi:hypothetical protein
MATRNIKTPGEAKPGPEDTTPPVDAAPVAPKVEGALPLESDIDPKTITRSVLTQSGWVCPA